MFVYHIMSSSDKLVSPSEDIHHEEVVTTESANADSQVGVSHEEHTAATSPRLHNMSRGYMEESDVELHRSRHGASDDSRLVSNCREGPERGFNSGPGYHRSSRLPSRSRDDYERDDRFRHAAFRYEKERQEYDRPDRYYEYGHEDRFRAPPTPSRPGFSSDQMKILQDMQTRQMTMFQQMLDQTLPSEGPSRSRKRSRSHRRGSPSPKRKVYRADKRSDERRSTSEDSGSGSDSDYQPSNPSTPVRHRQIPANDDEDRVSIHADPSDVLDLEDARGDQATVTEKVDDQPNSSTSDNIQVCGEAPSLEDPHAVPKGAKFDEAVLDWWKSQRTNILPQEKKEELIGDLKPDVSVAAHFKAPDLPDSVRVGLKKIKVSAWKDDNSLWSVQEDILKASLPLVRVIEEQQKKGETNKLLSAAGSLLGSAIQRLSMYRLRHAESYFKEGFLKEVSPSMTCLLGDKWTEQVEEEEKVSKVTQKVVKTPYYKDSSHGKQGFKSSGKPFFKKHSQGKFAPKFRKDKQNQSYGSNRYHDKRYEAKKHSFRDGQQDNSRPYHQKESKGKSNNFEPKN